MKLRSVSAIVLGPGPGQGILTPNLCQVCKKPGPGIVTVRGLNGHLFSAHRWPCAEVESLMVESSDPLYGLDP